MTPTKEQVAGWLNDLPNDYKGIARHLRTLRVTGYPGSPFKCPIAVYLMNMTEAASRPEPVPVGLRFSVQEDLVRVYTAWPDNLPEDLAVPLPPAVNEFIGMFDLFADLHAVKTNLY